MSNEETMVVMGPATVTTPSGLVYDLVEGSVTVPVDSEVELRDDHPNHPDALESGLHTKPASTGPDAP